MSRRSNQQPLILIIEDSAGIVRLLQLALERAGFRAASASDGESGLRMASELRPHAVLLDIFLPGMSGLDVLSRLRETTEAAVVVITASDRPLHRHLALERGASDFLVKPFGPEEVVDRVRAVLSRRGQRRQVSSIIRANGVQIDLERRLLRRDGEPVELNETEWRLLECLAAHGGEPVPNSLLLAKVWGVDHADDYRYLRLWMERLRRKVQAPGGFAVIRRVPGLGYALAAGGAKSGGTRGEQLKR